MSLISPVLASSEGGDEGGETGGGDEGGETGGGDTGTEPTSEAPEEIDAPEPESPGPDRDP